MFRNCNLLLVLGIIITTCGSVRFTKEPPKVVYVFKGHTARLEWEYHVGNKDSEFDINSPKWNFYTRQGDVMNIASEDMFQNWKWVIHRDTCPPRLLNPTRVFKESFATLVIKNVTSADNGIYGCSLVLLRTSLPINSKVTLSVVENGTDLITIKSTKQPNSPKTKGNVTNILPNITEEEQVAMLPWKESPLINKSLSDNNVKSWDNNSLVLQCVVMGSSRPNMTWFKPDGHDITNASHLTKEGSQLSVITLKSSDYGIYTCRAENMFGYDEHRINVTDSCMCLTVKSSQKTAALAGSKDYPPKNSNLGLKHKKLCLVCLAIIGVSWVMNVFLVLQSRTISKDKIRSTSHCMTDKTKQIV